MASQQARTPLLVTPLLVLALGVALAACGEAAPAEPATPDFVTVDPVTMELLEVHGLRPAGATASRQVAVGEVDELPWALYLEVSRSIGLDFAALEGEAAELRATRIVGSNPDAAVYVLVHGGRAVGAWVDPGGSSSGVLSLADRP
jgi:hypothetical protein